MNVEWFDATINGFKQRHPFQPFTVELASGTRHQVEHVNAIVAHEGHAVLIGPGHVPIFFDHEGVSQIVDGLIESKND